MRYIGIFAKNTFEDKFVKLISITITFLTILLTLYPLYYTLIYALNLPSDIRDNGYVYIIPRKISFDSFKSIFSQTRLYSALMMSVMRTILGTVTSVFFTAMVAYPLSKKYLVFRKFYLRFNIITMYFSGGIIPFYMVLKNLNLLSNFLVYIVPMLFSVFNAILFINFFMDIPEALEESAKIDGAGDFYIFIKIFIPLSAPIIATVSLFNGVAHWNDFFYPTYFIVGREDLYTLPVILFKIISQAQGAEMVRKMLGLNSAGIEVFNSIKYATMFVSILPIALVYPMLQKFFIKGMMLGSVKE
ncbi:MAG: carbohydrate ABC transporter permease [Clostridia bacterium]|nr:carbohydrate ABC transporter permease [Clostridia bacterium]